MRGDSRVRPSAVSAEALRQHNEVRRVVDNADEVFRFQR